MASVGFSQECCQIKFLASIALARSAGTILINGCSIRFLICSLILSGMGIFESVVLLTSTIIIVDIKTAPGQELFFNKIS